MRYTARSMDRLLDRNLDRRIERKIVPGKANDGSKNLAELNAAIDGIIQANKRMAKLWPHLFDNVLVDRNRREAEARRKRDAEIKAALDKIYGPESPL